MPSQLLLRRRFAVCFPAVPRRNGWGTVRFRRTPPPPGSIRLTGRSTTDADLAQAGFCGGMLRGAMTGRLPPVAFPLRHLFRKKRRGNPHAGSLLSALGNSGIRVSVSDIRISDRRRRPVRRRKADSGRRFWWGCTPAWRR